jgi:hypothetical protein
VSVSELYQMRMDNTIWRYRGPPLHYTLDVDRWSNYHVYDRRPDVWEILDKNPDTSMIAAGKKLYQLHNDGKIWVYNGPPSPPKTGWEMLGNSPDIRMIVAADKLYKLHNNGEIWVYNGPPMTGWQMLDNNPKTIAIAARASMGY